MNRRILILTAIFLSFASCGVSQRDRAAAGRPAQPVVLSEEKRAEFEANLAAAKAAYEASPDDESALIWYGRRLAYLGRFDEAIEVYTKGLKRHKDSVRLLRHRGHRYITIREFDKAVNDLQRAADLIEQRSLPDEIEPDGLPNARNIPLSTLHDNVYYHLALARYLRGEFAMAAAAWRTGLERVKPNDDMLVAYTFWLFLAESRAGEGERAMGRLPAITPNLDIIENAAYWRVLRAAKEEMTPEEALAAATGGPEGAGTDNATLLHGLGALALVRGDQAGARELFERCIATPNWPAFGFIAAETELARMNRPTGAPAEPVTDDDRLREIQRERQRNR